MNICLSGGAKGADLAWAEAAKTAGHKIMHFVFEGHKQKNNANAVVLTQDELSVADPHLKVANQTLKRRFPTNKLFVNNLLRRNYFQIADTKRVYAVINGFDENGNPSGGTAWALQMFVDSRNIFPVYVYDQVSERWYTYGDMFSKWIEYNVDVPKPYGIWTGIGTRDLTPSGEKAIKDLFLK